MDADFAILGWFRVLLQATEASAAISLEENPNGLLYRGEDQARRSQWLGVRQLGESTTGTTAQEKNCRNGVTVMKAAPTARKMHIVQVITRLETFGG